MLQATTALETATASYVTDDCSTMQKERCNALADQDFVPLKDDKAPQVEDSVNDWAGGTSVYASACASSPGLLSTSLNACLLQ